MSAQTNQWLQLYASPWESDEDALRRLARQQGLDAAGTQALLDEHTQDQSQNLAEEAIDYSQVKPIIYGQEEPSSYIEDPDVVDSLGRGVDLAQASAGQAVSGPIAGFLGNTLGWEAGEDWARAYGEDVTRRNLEEAAEVAPAKTREEIIAEDPTSLYRLTPEDWPTFGQMAEQAPPSFMAAGGALAAAIPAGIYGGPLVGAAVGMGVGNLLSSLQVGGEALGRAKEEPAVRRSLGIAEDTPFEKLDPVEQGKVTDLATKISQHSTYNRLFNAGALEMASYVPYGPFWARYLLDVGLGTASEEIDRRMYADDVIQGLVDRGIPEEKIPELREEILARGPTMRETLLQAFAMEATFGAPFAAIEGLAGDHRIDPQKTATKEQLALIKKIQEDDIKAQQKEFAQQDQNYLKRIREEINLARDREKFKQEAIKTDKLMLEYKDPRDLARSPEETALYSTVKGKKPVIEGKGTAGKQMKGARASGAQPGQPKKVRTTAGEFNIIDSKDKLSSEDRSRVKDIENQQRKNKKDIDDFLNRTDDFPMTEEGLDALDDLRYERARLEHERAKIMAPTAKDGGKKLLAKTKKDLDSAQKRVDANKKRRGPQEAKERLSKAGMGIKPDTDPNVDIPINETYAAGLLGFKDKDGNVDRDAYRSIFPDQKPEDTIISFSKISDPEQQTEANEQLKAQAQAEYDAQSAEFAKGQAARAAQKAPANLSNLRFKAALNTLTRAMPGLKNKIVFFDNYEAGVNRLMKEKGFTKDQAETHIYSSEGFVSSEQNSPIYLVRENIRGIDTDQAISRLVEVVFHEGLGHKGLRESMGGKNSKQYQKFINGFYKANKKNIDSWAKADERYADNSPFVKAEEYIAVHFAEYGAKDPTLNDKLIAGFQDLFNSVGLSKKVNMEQVKVAMSNIQNQYMGTNRNIITGAGMAQAATGAEAEDVTQSRISDYDRFVSFGGKPPLAKYDRKKYDPAKAPKKTAEDAERYVDASILEAMKNKVWPERLVSDLANFDKLPKAFQDSFRKSMKSGLRKREQELANAVLMKGREAYLQKKKGNVTPDVTAPKGFEPGGAKWKELVDDVPKFARTTPEIQRAMRNTPQAMDISQSAITVTDNQIVTRKGEKFDRVPGKVKAWKLLVQEKDGSVHSIYSGKQIRYTPGEVYEAQNFPDRKGGRKERALFHAGAADRVPHLEKNKKQPIVDFGEKDADGSFKYGRVYAQVEMDEAAIRKVPMSQGGDWVVGMKMKLLPKEQWDYNPYDKYFRSPQSKISQSRIDPSAAYELAFGEGTPYSAKYGNAFYSLSPQDRKSLSYEVGGEIADISLDEVKGVEEVRKRVNGYGFYKDYDPEPNVILNIKGSDNDINTLLQTIGYLAQQTSVVGFGVNRNGQSTGFDFEEMNGRFKDQETLTRFYKGLRDGLPEEFFEGASMSDASTARMVAGRKLNNDEIVVITNVAGQLANDLGLRIESEHYNADFYFQENDWNKNAEGELYTQGIQRALGSKVSTRITGEHSDRIEQSLQKGLQDRGADLSASRITDDLSPETREAMQAGWKSLTTNQDLPDLSTAGKRIKYLKKVLGKQVSSGKDTPFRYTPDGAIELNQSKLSSVAHMIDMTQYPVRAAFHGSARRVLEDMMFKLKFLLTGEGHILYGWGLYFTEDIDVARWYRNKDVERKALEIRGLIGDLEYDGIVDGKNVYKTGMPLSAALQNDITQDADYIKQSQTYRLNNEVFVSNADPDFTNEELAKALGVHIVRAQKRILSKARKFKKNKPEYYEKSIKPRQGYQFKNDIKSEAYHALSNHYDVLIKKRKAVDRAREKVDLVDDIFSGEVSDLFEAEIELANAIKLAAGLEWLSENSKRFGFDVEPLIDASVDKSYLETDMTGGIFKQGDIPNENFLLDVDRDLIDHSTYIKERLEDAFSNESVISNAINPKQPPENYIDRTIERSAAKVLELYTDGLEPPRYQYDGGEMVPVDEDTVTGYDLYMAVAEYFRDLYVKNNYPEIANNKEQFIRLRREKGGDLVEQRTKANHEGKKGASLFFDEAGIPGMQYMIGADRGKNPDDPDVKRNFVIWDQDIIGQAELSESRLRDMSQAQEDYIKPTYNSFLKQIPKPKIDDYEKVYGKGFVKDFFEVTEPNYRALSAPVNNPLDALANDISMSALKMEMDMRRQQIDKMPEGSNMRIEAIRDLHRMYMLNPLDYNEWKKSKYAKELKNAPPEEFSFSKLFKNLKAPTKDELALATDLLEKGQIMMDPALFRAMMGDAPNAISIVTPFMVKMRDKVLNGKTTDRMLFKALFMTSASQGMSGNSPFSSFTRSGGARQMPTKTSSTWGTEKTVRSPMNLYGLVDAINDEAGRGIHEGYPDGVLTTDMVIDWWNKTPLAHVSEIPFAKAVYPDEPDMTFPVNKDPKLAHTDESIFEDLSYIRDELPNGKKIRTNRAVGVDLAKRFMNDGYKVVYTHGLKMKPGDQKPRVIENPEYTAWRKATKTKDHPVPEYHGFFDDNGNFQLSYKDAPETGDIATARTVKEGGKNHKKFITQTAPDRWLVEVTRKNGEVESRPLGENFNIWFRDPKDQVNPNVKTGAIYVPRFYNQDDGKIRAEDGIAYWLSTPDGQKLLKFVDVARKFKGKKSITHKGKKLTYDDWYKQIVMLSRRGVDIRTAMGDDRLMQIITGKKKESLKRGKGRYAFDIHELTDYINDMAAKAPETIGKKYGVDSLITKKGDTPEDHINKAFARLEFAKSIGEEVQTQHQVAVGKEGWNKHHYGLGDLPTVDAIEMNILLAGSTSLNWAETPIATGDIGDPEQFLPGGPGEPMTYDPEAPKLKVQGHWRQQLIKRMGMLSRPKDYDFGPLAKYMRKPSGKQYSGEEIMKGRMLQFYENIIYKVPPIIDENGTVKKAGVKHDVWKNVDDDLVYHFVHHWMWDRAKGVSVNSMWPSGNLKDGFIKAVEGEIGAVESTFRPGIYQAMIKDWFTLTADETRDHHDVLSMSKIAFEDAIPGEISTTIRLPSKMKNYISRSGLPVGVTQKEYDELWERNHQITISDRMPIGYYQWFDPNNTTPQVLMTGGLGHTLFESNIQAGAVWAGQTPNVTTGAYRTRDYFDAPFMDIILLDHDTHYGNSKMHYILVQEVNNAIKKGIVKRDAVNERIKWILNNPGTAVGQNSAPQNKKTKEPKWKTGPEALGVKALQEGTTNTEGYQYKIYGIPEQDAAGNAIQAEIDNNFKIKIKGNGSDMKTRLLKAKGKDLWAKYNAYASLTANNDAIFLGRTRFWQIMLNQKPTEAAGKNVAGFRDQYGRTQYDLPELFPIELVQHIIDQTTDFAGVPKGSMAGIFKLDDDHKPVGFKPKAERKNPFTGRKNKFRPGIYPGEMNTDFGAGVVALTGSHPDYPFYYRGNVIATFENPVPPEIWTAGEQKTAFMQLLARNRGFKSVEEYMQKGHKIDKKAAPFPATVKGQRMAVKTSAMGKAPSAYKLEQGKWTDEMIGIYENPRYWDVGINYSKLQISQSAAGLNSQRPAGTWTGKVQNWLRQKIDPLGTLPGLDEYLRTRRLTKGKIYKIEQAGRKVYQALKDTKNPKAIYDFLTTRGANAGMIKDANERSNAVAAKAAINMIGQQLLDAGLLGKNALDAHGDRYLPRMYLKYLLDENDQNAIAMGLKPGDLGYLKRRRNIDEGVRQLILGEVKDPAFLSAKAMMVPGRDLALLDWLGDIAQNPDWVLQNNITRWDTLGEMRKLTSDPALISELQLRDTEGKAVTGYWLKNEAQRLTDQILPTLEDGSPKEKLLLRLIKRMNKRGNEVLGQEIVPDGWKKVPNTKRYGDLRGMVIRKEIYDDILGGFKSATGDESFAEQVLGDTGAMGKFNRFFKWAKVSANPPSWVRNFVSNMILMNLSGVPMYRLPGLFISAVREMKNKGKYYDVAERNGLIAGTFSNVELGRIEREFSDLQRRMKRGDRHPMNWVGQIQGAMNWTRDKSGDWYGGIDTFGKIMMVKHAMEKGMDEASAVANAEKWLFDYSLVKPSVRYLRNAAMGAPFITFTSKVAPLLMETIATKPWRFAPYWALGWALTEMFKNNNELDEEQLEGLKTALVPYLREKASAGNVVPLPWLDDNGKVQFFDLSYLFPWGMFSEMGVELYEGKPTDAMKTMGMMGGPMVSMAAAITTGIDPFTRRRIANELDTPWQQGADWLWYYYNLAVPPWMHADFGVGKRVYEAMTGELTPEGEQRFTIPQALARVGGMNVTPIDPVTSRRKSIRSMQSDILKLTRDRNRNIRERINMKQSKEEINEARKEFNERIKERRKELREFIKKTRVPEQLKRAS